MSQPGALDPKQYIPALELLKQIDFFKGVGDEVLKTLLPSLQYQKFAANSTILFQGEIANNLFIIARGKVEITTKHKGAVLPLAELETPHYFGEISLLTPTSATATVKAGEDGANVLLLAHDAISKISVKIPDIQQRIQKIIDARIASKKQAKAADSEDDN